MSGGQKDQSEQVRKAAHGSWQSPAQIASNLDVGDEPFDLVVKRAFAPGFQVVRLSGEGANDAAYSMLRGPVVVGALLPDDNLRPIASPETMERLRRMSELLGYVPLKTGARTDQVPRRAKVVTPNEFAKQWFGPSLEETIDLFRTVCWGVLDYLSLSESINSDIVLDEATQNLRRAWGAMDDKTKTKTIAGLMAYVAELQKSGALDALPSDRLARVAHLIGEATMIVRAVADDRTGPPLYASRQRDPVTLLRPTAFEWFEINWKPKVDAGEIFADDIKAVDEKLYVALAAHQKREGKKLRDLVPVRSRRKVDQSPEQLEAQRKQTVERATFRSRRSRLRRSGQLDPS